MNKENELVFPGEEITTEEEFAPGKNTFAEKGAVRASIVGKKEFDDATKEARIKGTAVTKLRSGDIVTAKVRSVSDSKVLTSIISVENEEGGKKVIGIKDAALPVRNVSNAYVTNLKTLFKIGDIVRARVSMANRLAVDLETNSKGFGVIKAYCHQCRQELNYSNGKLMCLNCGNVEERKWFEAEDERSERRGGFEGGDRGRGGFGDRRGGGRSFGGRGFGERGGERRSFSGPRRSFGRPEGRSFERGGFRGRNGGRSFGGQGERSSEGGSFGNNPQGDGQSFGNRSGERTSFRGRDDRRTFGNGERHFEKGFKNERRHFSDRR
ncbi:MAG: exosome complex RNA-binding protein Csl4 [archaeon]|jgi:exosome complex RNA-binding protein Csl4